MFFYKRWYDRLYTASTYNCFVFDNTVIQSLFLFSQDDYVESYIPRFPHESHILNTTRVERSNWSTKRSCSLYHRLGLISALSSCPNCAKCTSFRPCRRGSSELSLAIHHIETFAWVFHTGSIFSRSTSRYQRYTLTYSSFRCCAPPEVLVNAIEKILLENLILQGGGVPPLHRVHHDEQSTLQDTHQKEITAPHTTKYIRCEWLTIHNFLAATTIEYVLQDVLTRFPWHYHLYPPNATFRYVRLWSTLYLFPTRHVMCFIKNTILTMMCNRCEWPTDRQHFATAVSWLKSYHWVKMYTVLWCYT